MQPGDHANLQKRFVRHIWYLLLLAQLIPLLLSIIIWNVLAAYSPLGVAEILAASAGIWLMAAIVLTLSVIGFINRPLAFLAEHLGRISKGDLNYRTNTQASGWFASINKLLNDLSSKLASVYMQSEQQSNLLGSEAGRLRNVLNTINYGVIALDKHRNILLINKAGEAITGCRANEANGQSINKVLPLQKGEHLILDEWLDEFEQADLKHQQWESVSFNPLKGEQHYLDVEVHLTGTDPHGIRTLITFHDRTAAQEEEDLKIDFVALAAHELRTPVTVIRGYLEILETELGQSLSPEHKEFMRKLSISTTQLAGFINNILHVSRIEHGNLNLKFEPTDWQEVVSQVCDELQNKASVQHKTLKVEIPDNLPKVAVDRMSITEVINNLIDNAIKYGDPETTVTISVSLRDKQVETVVQDQGQGIPENAVGKLFTKFYRSYRTRGSHRGTGLGLYMSKSIIEAHGGTIWVESKEGVGSRFGFLLPIATKDKSADNEPKIIRGVHGWIKNHSLYRG